MFLTRNGHLKLLLLLLALTHRFVIAAVGENKENVEALTKAFFSSIQVPWINAIDSVISSSESACAGEIRALSAAIHAQEMWALEMLDSSTKMQSGILQGNVVDLGMYEQCVAVNGMYNGVNVRGKHCMVTFSFEALKLTSSVCLPSSCNETQALHIAASVIKHLSGNSSLRTGIRAKTATCARIGSEDFSVGEILTMVVFSVNGGFILLCTFCDLLKRIQPEKSPDAVNTLAKFSLYTNTLAILSTVVKPGTMPVLNGIRFASICWIVALHHHSTLFGRKPLVNLSELSLWSNTWSTTWYQIATFGPDNFFLLSGFLTSYQFFKTVQKGRKCNLPMMYFHRYIRLTPCVAIVVLFVAVLYHRIGNGPLWKTAGLPIIEDCRENWWYNLLYIQNILSGTDICLLQSWFLAADMQLFLISPIILYPLYRWPKYGLGVWCLFLLASIVTPAVVVGLYGYTILGYPDIDSFDYYYIRAYTRAFPYLLGILAGFDIATERRHPTKRTAVFGWIVTCILLTLSCVATRRLTNPNIEYNLAFQITCAGLLRPCWSVAMVWIIYACIHGYGGLIGRFLSSPIFLPLSRVSYGIYLVHLSMIHMTIGTSAIPGILTDAEFFDSYLGVMVRSSAVSGLISLFFEMPVMVLEKILKGDDRKRVPAPHVRDVELKTETATQSQPNTGI